MAQRQMRRSVLLPLAIGAALCAPPARSSQIVFESDGSSLSPFYCHYLAPDVVPTIDGSDGLPPPSIEFATEDIANYSFAPYVLPSLAPGQTFRGSLDLRISGETNLVEIAGFGVSISASCDYDPDTGPADGRWPFPTIFYDSSAGALIVDFRNESGDVERQRVPYALSLGSWHHAELTMVPAPDGAYDFELRIDGGSVVGGRSFEEIRANDSLGILLGAVGSGFASRVAYDNVRIELEEDSVPCDYGPVEEPWVVFRGHGAPVLESATWESCGGRGTMELILDGVSSARVLLNGSSILGPDAFNQNVTRIVLPVHLVEGENRLEVELRGRPGASLAALFVPASEGESRNVRIERLPPRPILLEARDPRPGAQRSWRLPAQVEVD